MKYETINQDNERVYVLQDEFLSPNTRGFEEDLVEFIKKDSRDILLDLTNVSKIDSMSIALILRIKSKISNAGRALKLTNPNESVLRILELAGLNEFLLD